MLVPLPADPGIGHGGVDGDGDPQVEALADAVIAQIADWAGIPDLAERIVVRRTVGPADFVDRPQLLDGQRPRPGAHPARRARSSAPATSARRSTACSTPAASTIPGIGLPMCLISAELVLKRLRGDTSADPAARAAAAPAPSPVESL